MHRTPSGYIVASCCSTLLTVSHWTIGKSPAVCSRGRKRPLVTADNILSTKGSRLITSTCIVPCVKLYSSSAAEREICCTPCISSRYESSGLSEAVIRSIICRVCSSTPYCSFILIICFIVNLCNIKLLLCAKIQSFFETCKKMEIYLQCLGVCLRLYPDGRCGRHNMRS